MELLNGFVNFCKRWLYLNTIKFAIPYFCTLIALSAIFKWIQMPPTYFSSSGNIFNVYFLKRSYWYILALLLPYVFCLHLVYGYGKLRNTIVPILRVLVAVLILIVLSFQFDIIGSLVGTCSINKFNNKEFVCTLWGLEWSSVDISGHIFHNMYGVLVVMEEASYFQLWNLVEYIVDAILRDNKLRKIVSRLIENDISTQDQAALIDSYQRVSTLLKINFCALGVLAICLHIANLLTVIYFHTVIENTLAGIVALILWSLCYGVVYPLYGINENSLEVHWNLVPMVEDDEDNESDKLNKTEKSSYSSV